ncbi:MAG: hypothetical protein CEN91_142 [Candidatus Berkelbacteria bacterium Licking1014_85]|uniref:Periplasmic immunogenic protein n=1 Tax=Candidatus Berkelbacteria bacterium Licking1014_85 TaxID=2017148 RepID=A0A554LLG2_9BACT|nr:MAG: hypothetical protein CEN91_142 [Candidatus Berkelbacteria bacterium Licking1014_85]
MKFWQIVVITLLVFGLGVGISVWQPWKTNSRTITVTGEGKVKAEPDISKLTIGVEVVKPTTDEAQKETSTKIGKILDAVKAKGVAEKDIQTQTISTSPKIDYELGKSVQNGYYGRVTATVTVRDTKKAQEILDSASSAGATSIYGPQLTFSDEKLEQVKTDAQKKAIENGKKKAQELAKAQDAKVGKVISISENNLTNPYLYRTFESSSVSSLKDMPVAQTVYPGENEITMTVSVVFALK